MISFLTIGLTFLFVTIFILVIKKKVKNIFLPKWVNVTAIFFVLTGIVLIIWQDFEIKNELEKRNWPNTQGEIENSKLTGNRAIRAEVKYRYTVNNSLFWGKSDYNIPGFGGKNYRRKNARIIKSENPVGKKITVFYNPENPSDSTLRYGPYYSNYMILGFGTFIFILGMFVIEVRLLNKNYKPIGDENA